MDADAAPKSEVRSTVGKHIPLYVSLASGFAVALGCAYLWGYWGRFNVNILDYIAISDVLKATALPLASIATLAVLGHMQGAMFFGKGGVARKPFHWLVEKIYAARELYSIFWLPAACLCLTYDFPHRWSVVSFIISFKVVGWGVRSAWLAEFFPHAGVRSILLMAAVLAPSSAFERGQRAADDVLSGREYDAVLSGGPASPDGRLRLIGHAGDVFFLWNAQRSTLVLQKLDSKVPLEIAHVTVGSTAQTNSPTAKRETGRAASSATVKATRAVPAGSGSSANPLPAPRPESPLAP